MAMRDGVRSDWTVADYLLARLKASGVDDLFGVPGDFNLGFLNRVLDREVRYVGTCNELNAAYAADGYARLRGMGAFVTTYAVGELSALERRGRGVRRAGAGGCHHRCAGHGALQIARPAAPHARRLPDPLKIFGHITAASTMLSDGASAPAEIDRVLAACQEHQQPVYICLPADVVGCRAPRRAVTAPTAALERPGDAPGGTRRGSGHAGKGGAASGHRRRRADPLRTLQASSPTSSSEPACPTPR